ncbi:hypothetical protein MPL3365_30307 [Mesorhizobium plurifarium]|uniref:Uncharacterized protein n=1 Tax=Mesorhizobium plurifarium TaxID=69974 RepID=A0A090GV46_MESPL|nr:hypothetical protein MPL3365_30307 [Mesorhizobium plurifarium]
MDKPELAMISRSSLTKLVDLLPLVGADHGSRDYDAALFKLFDARPVRRATVMDNDVTLSALPADALEAGISLRELLPIVHEDWVSETHALEVDYVDDDGRHVVEMGRHGYIRADGEFIESPRLELIPSFTTKVDDALKFKERVFGSCLLLTIKEEENAEWGSDYQDCLIDRQSAVIHAHRNYDLPHAIIGAVLGAMLSGFTHKLLQFKIIEDGDDDV